MVKKIILILLFVSFNCFSVESTGEGSLVLEKFFRVMIGDSEGGYVLFDKKPVCIHRFHFQDCFLGENEKHRLSVYLREGAEQWKKSNLLSKQSNIIIHSYNNQDSLAKNTIHLLFINKKLFLETVEDNLPLFQYVLGPSITPLELLAQLTNPDHSFHAVLKNDKVLIGILLGFGTQNSLYVSRIENLEEALLSKEQPPYKSQYSKINDIRPEYREMLLLSRGSWREANSLEASYGYHSPKEEMLTLCKKIDISSLQLARQTPNFIFGRLKEDKETDKLVNELEVTQLKINSLLSSKNFLKDVLQKIFPGERVSVKENDEVRIALNDSEVKQLPFIVAASVWDIIDGENEVYKKAFFEGMLDADKGLEAKVKHFDSFEYAKTKALVKARENLSRADKCLLELANTEEFVNVMPNRICYKTLQAGAGDALAGQSKVTVQYTLKTPDEKILADTLMSGQSVQLNLVEIIPGLALGMQNMKIGEIREIFIHPSLAYGIYTTMDKGIYLHAFVQLLAFENGESPFTQASAGELPIEISPTIEEDYLKQTYEVAYNTGYEAWSHYKQDRLYQLAQIQAWIKEFEAGHSSDISSLALQDLLNKHHWNLYQK